jgi:malonate transporter
MSAMAASLANSANLGIPIAVYVLGDASYVAPLLIFQLAFFTPLFLMILDSSTSAHRTTPLSFVVMILRNPMIVGSALGLVVAGTGWQVPPLVMEPIHLIGGAAIPAMLIAFGMSLNGSRPLQAAAGRRLDTLLASGFKLAVQPALAYLFARFALGMAGPRPVRRGGHVRLAHRAERLCGRQPLQDRPHRGQGHRTDYYRCGRSGDDWRSAAADVMGV